MSGRPLAGALVVITRREADGAPLAALVADQGGQPLLVPTIATAAPTDPQPLLTARQRIADYSHLALTSRTAARLLLDHVAMPTPHRPVVAALGPSTAAAAREAYPIPWPVDLVAEGRGGLALAQAMIAKYPMAGARVLFPRSQLASPELPLALRAAGALVDEVEAYRTVAAQLPDLEARLARVRDEARAVVYASPSAVFALRALLAERSDPAQLQRFYGRVASIAMGATTAKALHEVTAGPIFQAATPDDTGLLDAVLRGCGGEERTP